MIRKALEAQDSGDMRIEIWGDGTQTRSFCYIDDCLHGIDLIMHTPEQEGPWNHDPADARVPGPGEPVQVLGRP